MPKALRTAALVVGAVALVATGVGAAATAGLLGAAATSGAVAGVATATTLTSIGALAGAVSAIGGFAATAATPRGTVGGNATKFKIDKDAGIPLAFGRTWSGGNVVHRQYYDDPRSKMRNQRESYVTVHSLGPIKSMGPLTIDKVPVSFTAAGAAIGTYAGNMWLDSQLGACPEPRALRGPTGDFPGWNASSKLSGLAADLWTLDFDSKGEKYPNGVPGRGRVLEGVFAWDPRQDSTYPGGSGPCRQNDPATHVYTENGWLLGLQFAIGFVQNGHLMAGGGLPVTGIDVNAFVQAANTADANGWVAGGIVYTTSDNDWDILKMLAQAGAGEVFSVGGILTCTHSAPKVSLGRIVSADIVGDVTAPSSASIRQRRNTIIPRVRLESHGWEVVPLSPVTVPEYVALDKATRPREIEYPLIQSTKQAAEVAMYDMLNGRELDPIVLPCKIYHIGYRPGDCLTIHIPEANLVDREVVLRTRELDVASGAVTLGARSEDPAKHPFALGATTVPPVTPDLSVPELELSAPTGWAAAATVLESPGLPLPAIIVGGAVDNGSATAVEFSYRLVGTAEWLPAGIESVTTVRKEIRSVVGAATYEVSVRYQVRGVWSARLVLGPLLTEGTAADWGAGVTGPGKPADDATNSRDPDSPFGPDGTVSDVLDQVGQVSGLRDAIAIITDTPDLEEMIGGAQRLRDRGRQLAATQLADQLATVALGKRTDALTHVNGLPVGPAVLRIDRERQEGDEALAESLVVVKADGERTAGFLDAEVMRLDQARIDSDQAEATALANVRAQLDSDIDGVERTALGQVTRLDHAITTAEGAQASALLDTRAEFAAAIDDVERVTAGQVTRLDQAVADAAGASATAIAKVEAEMLGEAGRSRAEIERVDAAIVEVDRASAEAVARVAAELGDDLAGEVLRLDSVIAEDGRVTSEAIQAVGAEAALGIHEAEGRFAGDVMRLDTAIADQSGAVARALQDVRAELLGSGDDQLARLTAAVTRLDEAILDANGARAQAVSAVQAEVDGNTSSVEFLMRAVDGKEAVAQLLTRVDGTIAGFKINGRTYDFAVFAKRFTITDDETGKTYFYVDSERGAILEDVEVNRVRAGSINAEAMVRGAAGLIHYCRVAGDVACPRGTSTMIVAFEVTKVDDDSDLKVQAYLHCHSPDDIDFLVQIIVDGVAQQTAEYRLPFDNANSRGKLTLTPFDYLSGIPAGQHTVTVALTNIGPSTPLTIKARSVLEVTELRAGVAATAVPSTVPAGGGSGGGGGGGGGDVPIDDGTGGGTTQPVNQS